MLLLGLFHWWYVDGWQGVARGVLGRVQGTLEQFSFTLLLRTLFAPWRRITSSSNGSLEQRVRAVLDNIVSRAVGFTIRIGAVLAAIGMTIILLFGGGILLLLWPLLPPLSVGLIIIGLFI